MMKEEVWLSPDGELWVRHMDDVWGVIMQDEQNRGAYLDFELGDGWECLGYL